MGGADKKLEMTLGSEVREGIEYWFYFDVSWTVAENSCVEKFALLDGGQKK